MLQTIREKLKDSKTSAFVVSAWKGVGKSRIMRQLMDQIRQQPSLFDIIARVRAPGAEVLGEKMLMRIQNELNKLGSEEEKFRKTSSGYVIWYKIGAASCYMLYVIWQWLWHGKMQEDHDCFSCK